MDEHGRNTAKIYVAGHRETAGCAIVRVLRARGYTNLLAGTRVELDLCDQAAVSQSATEKPEVVYLVAARVVGIHADNTYRPPFIYQNDLILQADGRGTPRREFLYGDDMAAACVHVDGFAQPTGIRVSVRSCACDPHWLRLSNADAAACCHGR